jgi:hypothetical protein
VNSSQFLDLISKADYLEKPDFLQLKKVQQNFPYFQIPHVLIARYEFLKSEGTKSQLLAPAALTSPDRIWLKKLIEKPIPEDFKLANKADDFLPEDKENVEDPATRTTSLKNLGLKLKGQVDEEEIAPKSEKPAAKRRKPPMDDLIETIKRKEKRQIVDSKKQEQIDMIKAFSKKEFKLATIKEIESKGLLCGLN